LKLAAECLLVLYCKNMHFSSTWVFKMLRYTFATCLVFFFSFLFCQSTYRNTRTYTYSVRNYKRNIVSAKYSSNRTADICLMLSKTPNRNDDVVCVCVCVCMFFRLETTIRRQIFTKTCLLLVFSFTTTLWKCVLRLLG